MCFIKNSMFRRSYYLIKFIYFKSNSGIKQEVNWHSGKEGKRSALLQQALGWASLQHIRDDDGRLPALKVRVIPSAWDSDPEAKPWCLWDTHLHVTQQVRRTLNHSRHSGRAGEGQNRIERKDKIGGLGRKINEGVWWSERYRERAEKGGEIERPYHRYKEKQYDKTEFCNSSVHCWLDQF